VNLVFIIDVLVQFVMPVPDPVTGELIRSHAVLARKYLRGWFGVDVLSVLPIDVVVVAAPKLIPSEDTSFLRALKLLRIMRLFKLVRVLRASRIIQRWESSISMSTSSRSILSAWVGFIICLHWFHARGHCCHSLCRRGATLAVLLIHLLLNAWHYVSMAPAALVVVRVWE